MLVSLLRRNSASKRSSKASPGQEELTDEDVAAVEEFQSKLSKELRTGLLSLLVLQVIQELGGKTYGYQLIRHIKERTDNRLEFKEGTIYPILRHLEAKKLLSSTWATPKDGPARRYYLLTQAGMMALDSGKEDWQTLVQMVTPLFKERDKVEE